MLTPEKLETFKKRVISGQSLQMICWEFKLKPVDVKYLCKEHNLIVNSAGELNYVSKIHKEYKRKSNESKRNRIHN